MPASDDESIWGPAFCYLFQETPFKHTARNKSPNFFKNVNMQKGFEFLWVLDDFWSKNRKMAEMSEIS